MAKQLKLKDIGPEIEKRLDKFMDGYVTGLQEQLARRRLTKQVVWPAAGALAKAAQT